MTEKIKKWLENIIIPRCPKCNAQLSIYAMYGYNGAYRICPKCGEVARE